MIKLFVATPSLGDISHFQVHRLRDMEKRYAGQIEFVYPQLVHRIFHDHARNKLVDEFLETDCDILWFLDSDVVPHQDVLTLITDHLNEWKLAGSPYPVFMSVPSEESRQIVFTVYNKGANGMSPAEVPSTGIDFVDGVATGCIFIKREVIEGMEKPYFEFKYDPITRNPIEGEDLGFCKKMNKMGYKFFINYEYVCKHFKMVDLLEMNNYAIGFANRTLITYDNAIRPQLEKLQQKLATSRKPSSKLIIP